MKNYRCLLKVLLLVGFYSTSAFAGVQDSESQDQALESQAGQEPEVNTTSTDQQGPEAKELADTSATVASEDAVSQLENPELSSSVEDSPAKPQLVKTPEKIVAPEKLVAPEPVQAPGVAAIEDKTSLETPEVKDSGFTSYTTQESTSEQASTQSQEQQAEDSSNEAEFKEIAVIQESAFTPDPEEFKDAVSNLLADKKQNQEELTTAEHLYNRGIIEKLYENSGYEPLWSSISIHSLADSITSLSMDGLNPGEYQFSALLPYLTDPSRSPGSSEEAARIDVLLTEAFLRAMYNLDYGKVDPELLDADHNYSRKRKYDENISLYIDWIRDGRIDEAFNWARPKDHRYKQLQEALAKFKAMKEQSDGLFIPAGKIIKYGTSDSRVPLLRARLVASGDLDTAEGTEQVGHNLEQAIKSFQERHHLKVDGAVGPGTLRVMNISVDDRIQQIRSNLERLRWYFPRDLEEYLLVDVAGFQVYWMKNHEIFWQEFVQVGKSSTTTPIFRDQIEHIDFNPTWSVPPGINRRTILPSLKLDAAYLDKKGYRLLDHMGNEIDPYDIDWEDVEEMPFTVRQPPGWGNALGKVKFMFPNKHSVFLHDTNHREMFAKKKRTTSSGCIRLRNPFEFAEMLLENQDGWDRQRIDDIVSSNVTTRVNLDKPLPILIQYTTVAVTDGEVVFRDDIYRRDAQLLARLDGPFQLHLPDLPKITQERMRSYVKSASAQAAKYLPPDPEIIGEPENRYRADFSGSMFDIDETNF